MVWGAKVTRWGQCIFPMGVVGAWQGWFDLGFGLRSQLILKEAPRLAAPWLLTAVVSVP